MLNRPPSPPRRPFTRYSTAVKRLVPYQRDVLGYTPTQIATSLNMSLRVVYRVLRLYDEEGVVAQQLPRGGRPRSLEDAHVAFLKSILQRSPSLYLEEMASEFEDVYGFHASTATIFRALAREGITHKKLSKAALERCKEDRIEFLLAVGLEQDDRFVWVDESALNALSGTRNYGRAPKGQRAVEAAPFVRGQRYSLLPALCSMGIIHVHIVEGSFDGDLFCAFLRELVGRMSPYPGPRSILVLDNCGIHHVDGVQEIIDEAGVLLMYLPAYSPDYNPIELFFGWMKARIRHAHYAFQDLAERGILIDMQLFLYNFLAEVTPALAQSWIRHCGYM